ncbi:hypothetical protein ACS0TY_025601 [Phlomoides rotata]
MESLSRPPQRRKHSTPNAFSSSFSFKNPYEDVLLASGGERKSLEAHEYTEIFSGSSSIPVLDFPGLDDRVGPANSKLDYSSIFGGFDNGDVFVPYEDLINRCAKKTKPRIPAEAHPQESGSLHSSRKTKRPSDVASDQSVDGVKQQLNVSSNRTKQKNSEAPDGETHVAPVPAAPGFTHFADFTPWLDQTKGDKLPSLKREVSRTWSFSAEVGPVKNKGGSSREPSQMHDNSQNANAVNLKSQISKVPPPLSRPSNLSGNKDPRQSRVSKFASKDDASQKTAGECSPPLFGEEFDENSVDAVSAAALKKAIEQAQESIRIAKLIMERKREGYREAYGSKQNNAKGKHDELDHIFNELDGINRKFTPPLSQTDTPVNAANSKVERACKNVEADKEQGEAFERKSKLFTLNFGQSDRFHNDDHVKLEKVEAVETHRDGKDYTGLVTNEVCGTLGSEPEKVGNSKSLTPSTCKLAFNLGEMETGKGLLERRNVTVHHTEGSEVVPELVERPPDACQRRQRLVKSVEENELCHAKGHESMVERALDTSEMTEGMENSVDINDKEEHGKQLEEHDVMLSVENLLLRSEFNNVLDESCNLIENKNLEQEKTEKISENATDWKENDQHEKCYGEESSGLRPEEVHLWFEIHEQLTEALLEINKKEPNITPEIGEVQEKVDEGHEPETVDKKQDYTGDADKPKFTDELLQNTVEENEVTTSDYGAPGTTMTEANHCAEAQVRGRFCDAEETDNTLEGEGRSEGDHNKYEFQEAAYEEDADEAVELSSSGASTIFDEAHTDETSTMSSETPEACNVDSNNKPEEHWKTVKNYEENDTVPLVKETNFGIDKDKKAELFFHLHDNEILGTNSLHRSASEEIFVENKLHDAFEDLSSYCKMGTVGVMDADPEENLPKDEDVSNTTSDVHDAAQEYAAKIDRENLPEDLASDIRTSEFDFTDVRQVLEQASECDEVSVSASSSERTDGLSANETEECAENAIDRTSDKEELKDELEMLSGERECAEELIEGLSQPHSEAKETDKFKDSERAEGGGLNMKDNKENSTGTSPTEETDAKESVRHSDSNDQQQRIEAIKRGREREKDRIAVERAIREARERAFAEARERAERAAVERATAEARQRVMAEVKEKVEKANVVKRSVDKASTEAKLRAERAAVERATAEARGRALEKAMSLKISTEAGTPADRHPTERVSSSSRNNVLKHSFSSSDLESGMNTESAQRRKARLERHQRIMERAAKALAEKNMRDLLAQKEQSERNRLAESLDADIKRWATGKEGNLRALLSTLQYILGTDSGWQPISLTEIITIAAVKKAYRKATLYVHPDKLQQRGASVQQKYICEKVFDLLKAAWNRFNSDER